MAGQDPFSWSVDQVVEQICTPTSFLRTSIAVKPVLNLPVLADALRENDIDGESLLSLEDANVKDDIGISSFGQRREIRKVIQHLRSESKLYKSSLKASPRDFSKRSFSERDPSPETQPLSKKRRIQPMHISTEPLTKPDDFDPNDLSDHWKDFLNRHQEESDEECLRPYKESDVEIELDSDVDQSLIDEMESEYDQTTPPVPRLSIDEVHQAIDEALQAYKDAWNSIKRPKKYNQARRRWLQAVKAGTRKPQQYALRQDLDQMRARLSKFRKAVADITNDYHRTDEVKRNCANLQATVEDCIEKEYYLEVLSSNEPPEKPSVNANATIDTEEQLLEGEELLESSDAEQNQSSSEDTEGFDEMDVVPDDDSGLSLPYDPTDHDWNPRLPVAQPELSHNTLPDPFVETPGAGPVINPQEPIYRTPAHLSYTWPPPPPSPSLPDRSARSTPLPSPGPTTSSPSIPLPDRTSPTVASFQPESLAPDPVQIDFSEDDSDLDRLPRLPRSRYRHQGTSVDTAINLGSSPPASATEAMVSDQSVKTPPLNPTTPSKVKLERTPAAEKWPDIQVTRALKWTEIDDERTALCKIVYRFARQNAADVLEYSKQFTILEMPSAFHAMIAEVQDQQQDDESHSDDDMDPGLLWLHFFVTFLCKKAFKSIWRVPEAYLDEAYNVASSKVPQYDRLLKPLLQHYISTKTDTPSANAYGQHCDQQYKESGVLLGPKGVLTALTSTEAGPLRARSKFGTRVRQRASKTPDLPESGTEAEVASVSAIKKRKRAVQQSQEALMQQAADQTRVQEQEQRREMLMSKLQSQEVAVAERKVPINTDPDNVVFLDQHIAQRIKEHQITGIQFIWRELIEDSKHQGALLAHTMGLGKTMQVISFLVTLAQCNASSDANIRSLIPQNLRSGKVLILCPASLVDNWYDEILMWTPPDQNNLLGSVYKGLGSRHIKLRNIELWAAHSGVMIISYESVRALVDDRRLSREQRDAVDDAILNGPAIVIGDEAHKMKNAKSSLNKLAQRFRTTSRIALTGSPLNNHLEEYHTMINWIAPGYLGTMVQFRDKYSEPIERGLWEESTRYDRRKSLERLYVLKRDLAPKIDRKDISAIAADMPQKTEFYITIPLTVIQRQIYSIMVQHILGGIQNAQGPNKVANAQLWSWLAILSWLCNHPSILIRKLQEKKDSEGFQQADEVDEESLMPANIDLTESPMTALLPRFLDCFEAAGLTDPVDPTLSVRAQVTQMLIEEAILKGERTLLFSHSIPTLDFLEAMLQGMNIPYLRIDGSTRTDQRQAYTKRFNDAAQDLRVFLISTRAGGLGLNLQGATRVIIYDFGFNPSWEEQAVGRAYRLGQKQPVFVYKMRAGGTFEDAIYNKSIFKTQLFSRVVDQKNVVRHASKKIEDYLFEPKEVEKSDFEECLGKDDLLDRVLERAPDAIRNLILTETFQREDEDDELTPEERLRADEQVKLESLARTDPAEYHRLKLQRERVEAAERVARQPPLVPMVSGAPPMGMNGQLHFDFSQVFRPSVSSQTQFPGGSTEAIGAAGGVQEDPGASCNGQTGGTCNNQ